jgi:hypothetical protein
MIAPKIMAPMTNCLDKTNSFSFISRQFDVLGSYGPAIKSDRPILLMQNSTKPDPEASQSTMKDLSKSGN